MATAPATNPERPAVGDLTSAEKDKWTFAKEIVCTTCPGGATMAQSLGVVVFPGKKGSAGTAIANYACAICGGNQSIEIAQ